MKLAETFMQPDSTIVASINEAVRSRLKRTELWPKRGIRVVVKPIACVPMVGANDEYRTSIARSNRDIAAMEMESTGVLSTSTSAGVEFLSVRGISDGADFQKKALELGLNDENRRFALDVAVSSLDALLALQISQKESQSPSAGIEIKRLEQSLSESEKHRLSLHEDLFSYLVYNTNGDFVDRPITQICNLLRSPECGQPVVVFGGKGVGKTTLLQLIHAYLPQLTVNDDQPDCLSVLIRISSLEVWTAGVIDEIRTRNRVDRAKERLGKVITASSGKVIVLIDGLNQTGHHRTRLVADLAQEALRHKEIRLLLSAENESDVRALYRFVELDIRTVFDIAPIGVDNQCFTKVVEIFAKIKESNESRDVIADLLKKEVRAIDLFILSLFFGRFRGFSYRQLKSLAECYSLYCTGILAESQARNLQEAKANLSDVAKTAFDILISREVKVNDINKKATAKLISSHNSVANFLVAHHILDVIHDNISNKSVKYLSSRLNYVFPAEVNGFTKQMMAADRNLERDVVEVIKNTIKNKRMHLNLLSYSHLAYLAGRVSSERRGEMLSVLKQIAGAASARANSYPREARMLRRTVLISRSMLGDDQAAIEYAEILLSDLEESEFNRGFHLEYYGDSPFEPDGQMASRDDGVSPCNRTFVRLMDRIRTWPRELPPLIELLTLLSLIQIRHLNRKVSRRHRNESLEFLNGSLVGKLHLLPPNIRGYIERIAEDLAIDDFCLATVLDEWNGLTQILRTGWLRRLRDAQGDAIGFWKNTRIESVAEHIVGTLGLAEAFLSENPNSVEFYDKRKVIEMILIHDLAEPRLGDQLPKYNDPNKEEIEIWKYGAFATYPGVGDLWRVPKLLSEFNRGETIESRIAKDLDRLQFVLKARTLADGMSELERSACEETSKSITTSTVRRIEGMLRKLPSSARFSTPEPNLD